MSKRPFSLVAVVLITSVLWTAMAHACSDLRSMQANLQAPCDHNSSQDEPGGKAKKDDCDSVRYSMLSTQASSSEPELDKIHSIPLDQACLTSVSLARNLSFLWRSQAPPFSGLGISPQLFYVVLRI
jgi:hypothetical protein